MPAAIGLRLELPSRRTSGEPRMESPCSCRITTDMVPERAGFLGDKIYGDPG